MWRHHLRTALRALRRDRSHALLGGLSLAVAIAHRTSLGVPTVALVVAGALALAVLTVGVLAARAAHADPMRSLRTE